MIKIPNKTPESRGISSRSLLRFVKKLDAKKIPMHSLLIARGDDILLNAYWAPFDNNTLHRQNSVTKSFVALAIGLLEEDGYLRLTDRVIDYFPEAKEYEVAEDIRTQTVYDLLTMQTTYIRSERGHWVRDKKYDRIKAYFTAPPEKVKNTLFHYDSRGSYILGVIAERVSGKPLLEYLKERLLSHIGFSENADCILDPSGYSWSDSGLLCTAEDLYRVGKFIRQGGVWEGKRLMNEAFLRDAVSFISSTSTGINSSDNNTNGYGYQIWHEIMDGFGFHGMGMQYMICIPKLDFYLVCNADTQGFDNARAIFLSMYEDFVNEEVHPSPLPEDKEGYDELMSYCSTLKLVAISGKESSPIKDEINGKRFILEENKMGIKSLSLCFDSTGGALVYENRQGVKTLPFGILENTLTEFPEDGYSNMKIGESPLGYHHPCAVSAAWQDERCFAIKVQMTGNHLGGLYVRLGFSNGRLSVDMRKNTNCFLNEYEGSAIGYASRP